MSACIELNVLSFEESFLNKSYFSGENKLDRVLLSLLHLIDARSSDGKKLSHLEDYEGFTYLINMKNFITKIRKHPNKSIRYRYKVESKARDFSPVRFSTRYGIPLDTINGTFPLRFKNSRTLFHSLKISYALYLTMKMFKLDNFKSNQRVRGGLIFLQSDNLLSSIFTHIFSNFHSLSLCEKDLIKCLKNSLCLMVSKAMDQDDLPSGLSFNLFPTEVWKNVEKLTKTELVRFSFSCLQSKALCEEVPEDFILETLIKHRNQLSEPHRGLDETTLLQLKEKGRDFGKHVAKYYSANVGSFPTNKATFSFPRKKGGVKGDLVFNDRLVSRPVREDPDDRMEPFVIGLFGQPGQGKSLRINNIVSELSSLFPGTRRQDLTYQRTCHVDHWDGYSGQPIVIFDDLGQATDGHDIKEFQTLVSCCPYVLPMAHLDEKGQKFCSPIIICTSNLLYGSALLNVYKVNNPIIDDASFWRRFHVPIYVEADKTYRLLDPPRWIRDENLYFKKDRPVHYVNETKLCDIKFFQRLPDFDQKLVQQKWIANDNFSDLRSLYKLRVKFHENFRKNWIQTVVDKCQDTSILEPLLTELEDQGFTQSFDFDSGQGITKCLQFPAFPPNGPLAVRVEPIPEPLKVRTITAGIGDTFCLKPLQRAMWHALGDFPQYCLTHGTNRLEGAIERIYERSGPNDVWISGDYTAATDSFSIEGSKALLEGILESIDHEPTKRWAMKEISPHLLVYPKSSGLEPVLQKSGQLMGSLLSFPLLCLLNDCTAQFSGVSPDKYLINGDDILIRATPETYPVWKAQVDKFGLDLSPGKNYIHKSFGTVNSQLIVEDRVVGSGKQMVLDRRSRVLGECLRDLEFAMCDSLPQEVIDLFKSVNRQKLSRTVRSINVPVSHGGLSFSWGKDLSEKKSKRTAQLCYLNDMFRKIEPLKGCIAIPYLSIEEKNVSSAKQEELIFNDPVSTMEYHEDFLSPLDLQRTQKRCMTHGSLRDILLDQPLRTLPALSFLRTYQIECTDTHVRKELQKSIDNLFLRNFLQGGQEFGYKTFREEFLLTSSNLKSNTKETCFHIVKLMDLEVNLDYLKYINLEFDPTAFDPELFKKNLGDAMRPNQFDLPEVFPDFVDFSEEVIETFENFDNSQKLFRSIRSLRD